jgi:hypothetical protein
MASFLRIWCLTLVGLALAVCGLNLLVDPYDVFGTTRIPGFSLRKPGPRNHAMLAKTYQEARFHPATVLIGSSSTHIGLDANDPAWPTSMRPVYDFGIPGSNLAVELPTLRQAIALGGISHAVVMLDFVDFLTPETPMSPDSEDARRFLSRPDGSLNPDRFRQMADDRFLSLLTMGALADSFATILGQRDPVLLDLAPNGSANEADFIKAARSDGMFALFTQKDDAALQRAEAVKAELPDWQGPPPGLGTVAAIIDLAAAHHVTLTLALVPHHADVLDLFWRAGLWPRIEQFKTAVADVAFRRGGVAVWDFLDYSPYTTEPVPAAGDRSSQTRWFWEPNHFKKTLGSLMIQAISGAGTPPWGVRLTPDTVAARNAEIRAQRQTRICSSGQPPLLTTLASPPPDGCPPHPETRGAT